MAPYQALEEGMGRVISLEGIPGPRSLVEGEAKSWSNRRGGRGVEAEEQLGGGQVQVLDPEETGGVGGAGVGEVFLPGSHAIAVDIGFGEEIRIVRRDAETLQEPECEGAAPVMHRESGGGGCRWRSTEGGPEEEEGEEGEDNPAYPLGALPGRGEGVATFRAAVGRTGNPMATRGAVALAELPHVHCVFEVHHGEWQLLQLKDRGKEGLGTRAK